MSHNALSHNALACGAGVDGESIGPSASQRRSYGGKSDAESAPTNPSSRLTPSAGPSQASSVQPRSEVTRSFNNRNAVNSYTYRVALRHGRAPTHPCEAVQSYSSSNAVVRAICMP